MKGRCPRPLDDGGLVPRCLPACTSRTQGLKNHTWKCPELAKRISAASLTFSGLSARVVSYHGGMESAEGVEVVVEQAATVAYLFGWAVSGAAIGLLIAVILLVLLGLAGRRYPLVGKARRRTGTAMSAALVVFGSWTSFSLADTGADESSLGYRLVSHLMLVIAVSCVGWYFYTLTGLLDDVTRARIERDPADARRLQTQTQILVRVLKTLVVIATILGVLMTFRAARAPVGALLGSAGLLSIVAGLAAQSTLGNMFAGLQLAFTDAVRVGDTISTTTGSKEEVGVVEEVTLTNVVVRVWNGRRILYPSSQFTSSSFENWTRRDADQIGDVRLYLDWTAPVSQIRLQTRKFLGQSELWDGKLWSVQVLGTSDRGVQVRVVMSAATIGDRFDLECEMREKLAAWITSEIPWAVQKTRNTTEEINVVDRDLSGQRIAELAQDLVEIHSQVPDLPASEVPGLQDALADVSVAGDAKAEADPAHAARLRVSKLRAKEEKRLSRRERASAGRGGAADATTVMEAPTQVSEALLGVRIEPATAEEAPESAYSQTPEPAAPGSPAPDFSTEEPLESDFPAPDSSAEEPSAPDAVDPLYAVLSADMDVDLGTISDGTRMFSGSVEAEELGRMFAAPPRLPAEELPVPPPDVDGIDAGAGSADGADLTAPDQTAIRPRQPRQ